MADSHLPNSECTPGWKGFPFPRPSFLDAIKTTRIEGGDNPRYAGSVPLYWCANGGRDSAAHGGFSASVMLSTARHYCHEDLDGSEKSAPISIYCEFLNPLPTGDFHVVVKSQGSGSRLRTVQAELVPADPTNDLKYAIALVRFGSLKGGKNDKSIQPEFAPLPDRDMDCGRWSNWAFYYVNPPASSVRVYSPNDGDTPFWSPKFNGQRSRDQWIKLDDDNLMNEDHIALLSDMIPPIPLNYEEDAIGTAFRNLIPTMSFSIQFRTEIKDKEWLLTRATMRKLHDRRFDMDIQVIDDDGEIVATCNQYCAMIPRDSTRSSKKNARL